MIHSTHQNYFGCSNMQSINHNKKCCTTDDLLFKICTQLVMELNTNFSTEEKPKSITWLTVFTSECHGLFRNCQSPTLHKLSCSYNV